ncbi:MAG TPA: class I SAM-dependent methyltransferase [Terracidiphilus sp.]|nr:class I SAM-dependent methyltransferase [Terracidiphilus sp.]
MPEQVPIELHRNLEAYRTAAAVAMYSHYYLFEEEEYLFNKYYRAGENVLDLACGLGRTTLLLHEMGMQVRGADRSDVFVQTARRRLPYLDFRQGSYDRIEEADASFSHLLISYNGIDYAFPEIQRVAAIRECVRVLKPGGTLIFSSHNLKSLHWFSPCSFWGPRDKIRLTPKAFRDWSYVVEAGMHTFYASRQFVIRQAEECGLRLLETVSFRKLRNFQLSLYFSPYIHYAFQKPAE